MPLTDGSSLFQWFEHSLNDWLEIKKGQGDQGDKLVPPFLAIHPAMWGRLSQEPEAGKMLQRGSGLYLPILGEHVATYKDIIKVYVTW